MSPDTFGNSNPFLCRMLESSDSMTRQAVELINAEGEQGFRILDVFDFRKSGGILEKWFSHTNVRSNATLGLDPHAQSRPQTIAGNL